MTGLRISDILQLEWKHITEASDGGYCIRIRTEKTETETTLPISPETMEYCGERGEGKVFKGLQRCMTQQPLQKWLKAAGIKKHITFHCFRHTFASLMLNYGVSLESLSRMMGYQTIRSTQHYARITDRRIQDEMRKVAM